mgnify:CR=1 FL=1
MNSKDDLSQTSSSNFSNKRQRGHKRVNSIYTFELKDDEVSAQLVEPSKTPKIITNPKKAKNNYIHSDSSQSSSIESNSSELNDFFDSNKQSLMTNKTKSLLEKKDTCDSGKKIIVEPLEDDYYDQDRRE